MTEEGRSKKLRPFLILFEFSGIIESLKNTKKNNTIIYGV